MISISDILVVLVYIVCLFAVIKMLQVLFKPFKNKFNGLTGGDTQVDRPYKAATASYYEKCKYPRIYSLNNKTLKTLNLDDFRWMYKYDGIHRIVKFEEGTVMYLDEKDQKFKLLDSTPIWDLIPLTILECEELPDNNFYILDAIVINGKPVDTNHFDDRMKESEQLSLPENFKHIHVNKITDFQKLMDEVNHDDSTKELYDGMVIKNNTKPFFQAEGYKLKPSTLHTVDCYLKYQPQQAIYKLYIVKPKQFNQLDTNDITIKDNKGKDVKLMLMKTKYIKGSDTYDPNMEFIHHKDNFPYYNRILTNLLDVHGSAKDGKLDGLIVEMSYNGDQFFPIRIRSDKQFPNSFYAAINETEIICNPLG